MNTSIVLIRQPSVQDIQRSLFIMHSLYPKMKLYDACCIVGLALNVKPSHVYNVAEDLLVEVLINNMIFAMETHLLSHRLTA
jgi:hypothetical protein